MRLEKLNFSQFYYHGPPTTALVEFSRELIKIHRDPAKDAWHRLRTPEQRQQMLAERHQSGGPDSHGQNILAQLDDAPHGFIRNLYPYSAIMPDYFLHYCYWSKNGPIARLLVDIALVSAFPALSALVFENYGDAKSIPNWHVHAVVDTHSLQHTVYSHQPAIARLY